LLSRRCTQRQFLLKPSALTTQIFAYVLALAAEKTGVLIHAVCVLSNHWHAALTDPEGRMPEFMAYVHKYVAKAVNVSLDRRENLWATEQPSLVRLEDADAVLRKMMYTLLNPVKAGLVSDPRQWPGLWGYRGEMTVDRPEIFFRADGSLPETATLRFVAPPMAEEIAGGGDFYETLEAHLERHRRELVSQRAAAGKGFLGKTRVLHQDVYDRPSTEEARGGLSPRVASRHKWLREEALQRLRDFVRSYREAYLLWRDGALDVLFPHGTYALRLNAGVRVAAGP
jgi:REP element-mobilizing transposase RayT